MKITAVKENIFTENLLRFTLKRTCIFLRVFPMMPSQWIRSKMWAKQWKYQQQQNTRTTFRFVERWKFARWVPDIHWLGWNTVGTRRPRKFIYAYAYVYVWGFMASAVYPYILMKAFGASLCCLLPNRSPPPAFFSPNQPFIAVEHFSHSCKIIMDPWII